MKNIGILVLSAILFILITEGFSCGSVEFESAKLAISQRKYNEAIPYLEKELAKNPNNDEAWYLLGETKGKLNDYQGMNQAFEKALKISNKTAQKIKIIRYQYWAEHMNNAVSYMRSEDESVRDYEKAAKEYQRAAEAWPDTSISYRYLAFAYMGLGDVDNVIINSKKAWDLGKDTMALSYYGRYLLQRANINKEKFEKENSEKLKLLKNIKDIGKGSSKKDAVEAFGNPDTKKKDSKDAKKENWEYKQYGLTLTLVGDRITDKKIKQVDLGIDSTLIKAAMKDYNNSIEAFETIKKMNPKDNENLTFLVQAYVGADRIEEATKSFKLAVENDPSNKTNHYILGVLYRGIENYDEAINEFKKALAIDPDFSDVVYEIGATYYNWGVRLRNEAIDKGSESMEFKKKFEDALPWMERISQIRSEEPHIWVTLGTIYTFLGQKEKATKSFETAEKLQNNK